MALHVDRIALRVVFVLIGAALALATALLDITVIALVQQDTELPLWAVVSIGTVLVVVPLVVLGLIPAMRTVEGVAATSLLGVDLTGPLEPARTAAQRGRTLAWFVLHLLAGLAVVAIVTGILVAPGWLIGPLLIAVVAVTALLGGGLAGLAPRLLGPSYAERIALLERDVDRAVERNRLAREIHDSVGHALSLVIVQAGAARRVIDKDPEFAVTALAAIEEVARNAAAELDHVLGLLRDDGEPRPSPAADLGALEELIRVTRTAGLSVEQQVSGDLRGLPGVVSREGYRVVQESLTNALRYSADGAVRLSVALDGGVLRIAAENPVADRSPGRSRGGRGLSGSTERVRALGGSLEVGVADDRWRLVATIPVRAAERGAA